MGRIRFLPITFEPGVIDEYNLHQYVCLITLNRMVCNITYFDLTSDLRSNFDLDFLKDKLGIIRSVPTRGTQWCAKSMF